MSFEQRHRRHDTIVGSLSGPVHTILVMQRRGAIYRQANQKTMFGKKTLPMRHSTDPVGLQRVRYLFPVGIFVAQRDDAAENAKPIMVGSPPCGKGHVISRLGINMLTNIAFQGLVRHLPACITLGIQPPLSPDRSSKYSRYYRPIPWASPSRGIR
jgi:hypothetical protein